MSEAHTGVTKDVEATRLLAEWIGGGAQQAITPLALEWARHVMLDWLAVTIAGSSEPLVRILAEEYGGSGNEASSLITSGRDRDAAVRGRWTRH